ncbi:MAG TPA: LuxR C-terminal-related transcriptional regulator [Thermoanaerobaculia bacterium]|nr:LuxR C-terminal-related transcriptional regulator [Thermoanaerobaculia bacterium]
MLIDPKSKRPPPRFVAGMRDFSMAADDILLALDHASDGVLIERRDRVVYINPRYAAILGFADARELIGAAIPDIAHPEDLDRLLDFARRRELGKPAPVHYTFRVRCRDGAAVVLEASVSAARSSTDTLITTIVRETRLFETVGVDEMALDGWNRLANRELAVVQLLLEGKRPKEIALLLGISEKTVATHRRRAMIKLNAEDDLDLFRFAVRHGLLRI